MVEEKRIRVAVYGGSFDPPTSAHIRLAQIVQPHCDQVWLSPCYSHMFGKDMTSPDKRLDMCRLAAQAVPGLVVSSYEIDEQAANGTYEIMSRLADKFPIYKFMLVIGQDNADKFKMWRNHRKLRAAFPFIVVPRRGYPLNLHNAWYKHYPHVYLKDPKIWRKIPYCSSTKVRVELAAGRVPKHLDPAVYDYIIKNKLYGVNLPLDADSSLLVFSL